MPISTDGNSWQQGTEPDGIKQEIKDFLSNHSDQAFEAREIADEVASTDLRIQIAPAWRQP